MAAVISAFGCGELIEDPSAEFPQFVHGPLGSISQKFFELGERKYVRVMLVLAQVSSKKQLIWTQFGLLLLPGRASLRNTFASLLNSTQSTYSL